MNRPMNGSTPGGDAPAFGPRPEVLEALRRGQPLPAGPGEAMLSLLGAPVTKEGLSRVLQPDLDGIRVFCVQFRLAPDQSVDVTLVGVNRNGEPVMTAERTFARGRTGSVEIHHRSDTIGGGLDETRARLALLEQERDLLRDLGLGAGARVTLDAENEDRHTLAVWGFEFADETFEGPPVRSERPLDPTNDRARMISAASAICVRLADEAGAATDHVAELIESLRKLVRPIDFSQLELQKVSTFGRTVLTDAQMPNWRAALYAHPRNLEHAAMGEAARRDTMAEARAKHIEAVEAAIGQLGHKQRSVQIRALKDLARIAPHSSLPHIKDMTHAAHRGVAVVARQTVAKVSGTQLMEHLATFARTPDNDGAARGLAYRVLAEYHPSALRGRVPMLRVHPDARIQRAVVPLLLEPAPQAGPALAAMLSANPWSDRVEVRPGLLALRIELIEALARIADPRAVPVLMEAQAAKPAPPVDEQKALSRALVAQPDPRARRALAAATERMDRPAVP